MNKLKIYKTINSIPLPYEPNSIYMVRKGIGIDYYVSNSSGTIVYALNLYKSLTQTEINLYNPYLGEQVYNLTDNQWQYWNGTTWINNYIVPENTQWKSQYRGTLSTTLTISTTEIDVTNIFGTFTNVNENNPNIFYDSVNNVFKANNTTSDYYSFLVALRLSASLQGGVGTDTSIDVILRRPSTSLIQPNGLITFYRDYIKNDANPTILTNYSLRLFQTDVNSGGVDPYQTEGFKIYFKKASGNDIVLSNTNPQTLRFVK